MFKNTFFALVIFTLFLFSCSQKKEDSSEIKTHKFKQNPHLIEEESSFRELGFSFGIPKTFAELDSFLFEKYSPLLLDLTFDPKLKIEPLKAFFSDSISTLLFISKVNLPDSLNSKQQINFLNNVVEKHFDSFQFSKTEFRQDSILINQWIIRSNSFVYLKFLFPSKGKHFNSIDFIVDKNSFNEISSDFIEAAISSIKRKK